MLEKVCAITPGRANNSQDCLLFARSNPLRTRIKRKSNKSTCALFGVREGIRTPDLRFRKPTLYPTELHRHFSTTIIAHLLIKINLNGRFVFQIT